MNIAIGVIVLFLLLIPGMAFRAAFSYGPLTKKYSRSSAFDDFVLGMIPGVFFQLLFAFLNNLLNPWLAIDFASLGQILFGPNAADEFGRLNSFVGPILLYNIVLIAFCAFIGYKVRKIIRKHKWDLNTKIFRFNNDWWYELKGEFVLFKELGSLNYNSIDCCVIDCLVKVDTQYYIYTGVVEFFYPSKEGSLDKIVLSGAQKAIFPVGVHDEFKKIDSQLFVLKYSDVVNINIRVLELYETLETNTKNNKPMFFKSLRKEIKSLNDNTKEGFDSINESLKKLIEVVEAKNAIDNNLPQKDKVAIIDDSSNHEPEKKIDDKHK